jgi:hypothetical protein
MTDHKPPYGWWWPLVAGALAGIALRLAYSGKPGEPFATMMAGFIYFSPILVGAVTVYVAERTQRRTWKYYFVAPFFANCLYVAGTLLILVEGLICAIVIVPLFAVLGGLGGLAMGAICRFTGWPKPTLYCVAALPFLVGAMETHVRWAEKTGAVERSVVIDAPPHLVWKQILSAPDIRPEEIENEIITDLRELQYLRWTYRYYEDSFPPRALDDHVKLGGHYFDITDSSYTLTPSGAGTLLRVQMHYRVSTRFNWYADPVARLLLGNLAGINLDYYRGRSEAARRSDTG